MSFQARWIAAPLLLLLAAGCSNDETSGPAPIVFTCEAVATGQSLSGIVNVNGDDLVVRISSNNGRFTEAPTVTGATAGTVSNVTVQDGIVQVEIAGAGGSMSFDMAGRLTGPDGTTCPVEKSFQVSVNADGATVN